MTASTDKIHFGDQLLRFVQQFGSLHEAGKRLLAAGHVHQVAAIAEARLAKAQSAEATLAAAKIEADSIHAGAMAERDERLSAARKDAVAIMGAAHADAAAVREKATAHRELEERKAIAAQHRHQIAVHSHGEMLEKTAALDAKHDRHAKSIDDAQRRSRDVG
jgi:hypothetical protein